MSGNNSDMKSASRPLSSSNLSILLCGLLDAGQFCIPVKDRIQQQRGLVKFTYVETVPHPY